MSFFSQTKATSQPEMYLNEYKSQLTSDNTHFDILKKYMNAKSNEVSELFNVYENYDYFKKPDPTKSGIVEDSCILRQLPRTDSESHCVVNKETFTDRFNKLSNGILNFFDWDNIVVAGGLVNLAMSHIPIEDTEKTSYDIDMFVHSVNEGEAKKIMTRVYDSIKDIVPESTCVKTEKTVTVILPKPFRHIQFITTLYQSKEDLLHGFDLQSAKVLYDGKNVYTTMDGHFSLVNKTNVYTTLNNNPAYESRLYKYSNRGYQVFIPGFNKTNVSNYVYKTSSLKEDSNDLVRLLHYDKFGKNYSLLDDENRYYMDDVNYLKSGASSYNSVFFTRNNRVEDTLNNLRTASDSLLFKMKLKNKGDRGAGIRRMFKVHDTDRFPIYKVFNNIKLAFIHENNYDPTLEGEFFMNGPTFSKSVLCKYLSYNYNSDYYEKNKDTIDKYYAKNSFPHVNEFDDLYYDEVAEINITKILNEEFNINDLDTHTGKRDRLGRTYMKAAIDTNNIALVIELLSMNYDIFERLDEGMTSVHYAIRKNKHEIVNMMLDFMLAHENANVKYYDNSGCNLIHYSIMYSDTEMFKNIHDKLGVRFSDISWSIRFNDQQRVRQRRSSKYICCAKLCIMYDKIDILRLILDKYENFNDFRYIFVDSDLTDVSTASIISYTVNRSNFVALKMLCDFFIENNIDICINVKSYNINNTNLDESNITTIFMLEYYSRQCNKSNSNTSLSACLVSIITNLFQKKQYTKLLNYVDEWLPDVWTSNTYNAVHNFVHFDNIFGNKYVDTDKSLRLFSAVADSNWTNVKKLLKQLQYNMYIYSPDNTTVLSLCKNDSKKLSKVLKYLTEKTSNKTGTYSKNICDLLYINYSVLFNLDCLEVLLSDETHKENVLEYMHKNGSGVIKYVWNECNKKSDFTELSKLLVLLSKHKCEVDFKNLVENVPDENNKQKYNNYDTSIFKPKSKKYTSSESSDDESDSDSGPDTDSEDDYDSEYPTQTYNSINESNTESSSRVIITSLYPTINQLKNYSEILNSVKDECDEDLFNLFNKDNFCLKYYAKKIKGKNDFDKLLEVYEDLCEKVFLLDPTYTLIDCSWRDVILDMYYVNNQNLVKDFNILDNKNITGKYASTVQSIIKYLNEKNMLQDHISKLEFDKHDGITTLLKFLPEKYVQEPIKDVKGNTFLHTIVRKHPESLLSYSEKDIKFHNEKNDFGKTPMDYLETAINNSSKYDDTNIPTMVKIYKMFSSKVNTE